MSISIAKTKEILKRPDMSDEEAEHIRDGFLSLAEVIYEKWMVDIKTSSRTKITSLNTKNHGKPNKNK